MQLQLRQLQISITKLYFDSSRGCGCPIYNRKIFSSFQKIDINCFIQFIYTNYFEDDYSY